MNDATRNLNLPPAVRYSKQGNSWRSKEFADEAARRRWVGRQIKIHGSDIKIEYSR